MIPERTRSSPRRRGRRLVVAVVAVLASSSAAPASTPSSSEPRPSPSAGSTPATPPRPLPDGFVEMQVYLVAPTEMGNVVVLTDAAETVMVPIWVGETEALAIALRMDGAGFRRPLTHDLVDAVLRELGGQLVEVRIDSLESNTFVASLFIQQGEREILLDARASDSIALALGNGVPIFVSRRVLDDAGVRPHELGIPGAAPPPDPQIPL